MRHVFNPNDIYILKIFFIFHYHTLKNFLSLFFVSSFSRIEISKNLSTLFYFHEKLTRHLNSILFNIDIFDIICANESGIEVTKVVYFRLDLASIYISILSLKLYF